MICPLFPSHLGLSLRNLSETTTSLVEGTSPETIESQPQQDQLNSRLPNLAEEGGNKREEVMANLVGAIDGTPSMVDELDDNNTPLEHVSKEKKKALMRMESRSRVPTELMTLPSPRWRTPWFDLKCSATKNRRALTKIIQEFCPCSCHSLRMFQT